MSRAPTPSHDLWATWSTLLPSIRDRGLARADVCRAAAALMRTGASRRQAALAVAAQRGEALRSVQRWLAAVDGQPERDWPALLVDGWRGQTTRWTEAALAPEALALLKSDWLRPERPSAQSCVARLKRAAAAQGWPLPSDKSLVRILDRIPQDVAALARDGGRALAATRPAQLRDRSTLAALEIVNVDGHRFDVMAQDGDRQFRPILCAIQDIHSGKILAWRVGETESTEVFRLAVGDLVTQVGIPHHIICDNGRNFAAKTMTAGAKKRFRWGTDDDAVLGILPQLGIQVHFTIPYSGQSKPIERAFRDLTDSIARHPAVAGASLGRNTLDKPDNHGERAIPLTDFVALLGGEIAAHNARTGRTGGVCRGRSFDQVFAASYAVTPVTKATEEQRRLWLLPRVSRIVAQDGSLRLQGARYHGAFLPAFAGQTVAAHYDPLDPLRAVHVFDKAGRYLGPAPAIEARGFLDGHAAAETATARRALLRQTREQLKTHRTLTPAQVAAAIPPLAEAPLPEARIVRMAQPARRPTVPEAPAPAPLPVSEREREIGRELAAHYAVTGDLRVPLPKPAAAGWQPPAAANGRFRLARDIRAGLVPDATPEQCRWADGHATTAEYAAHQSLARAYPDQYPAFPLPKESPAEAGQRVA